MSFQKQESLPLAEPQHLAGPHIPSVIIDFQMKSWKAVSKNDLTRRGDHSKSDPISHMGLW